MQKGLSFGREDALTVVGANGVWQACIETLVKPGECLALAGFTAEMRKLLECETLRGHESFSERIAEVVAYFKSDTARISARAIVVDGTDAVQVSGFAECSNAF